MTKTSATIHPKRPAATIWPVLVLSAVTIVAGCSGGNLVTLSSVGSPAPDARNQGLLAGFGRADITTPPGFALNGNGPETRQSIGYRHHLFARALVLEDGEGERIALLVADLSHLSPLIHRVTIDTLKGRNINFGADRLIVASTHTHSAPGNFYGASQYNEQGSSLPGYDDAIVAFLAAGFADAIQRALGNVTHARAAWGSIGVTGLTRNRSFEAFLENEVPTIDLSGAATLEDSLSFAVDTALTMLRVDRCTDAARTDCAPAGAFSIFAVHGTGNPSTTDVLDGDIHAIVERVVETHIDSLNGAGHPGFKTDAYHLIANGTEGDVSPVRDSRTRCERHGRFDAGSGPGGPRRPPPPEEWSFPEDPLKECMALARQEVRRIGSGIGRKAVELFDRLGDNLSDDLKIERAFTSFELTSMSTDHPLCDAPRVGVSSAGGSFEDGRTRIYGLKILGLFPTRMHEGGKAARNRPKGCQGHKKPLLGFIQGWMVKEHSLPATVQLAVVQIGSTLMAAVPAEVTTVTGLRMKGELLDKGPGSVERAVVISLANGYLQYIATAEEYRKQHYEGGSTLYGPNTAAAFTERLGSLAESIAIGNNTVSVTPITVKPGKHVSYFRPPDEGPPPDGIERTFHDVRWDDTTLVAEWMDVYPGRLRPSDGLVLEIQRGSGSGAWSRVAWDDRHDVEVRAMRRMGRKGYRWEVRYEVDGCRSGDSLRVQLYPRPGSPESVTSSAIPCR